MFGPVLQLRPLPIRRRLWVAAPRILIAPYKKLQLLGNSQTVILRTVSMAVVGTSESFEGLYVEVIAVSGNCQRSS